MKSVHSEHFCEMVLIICNKVEVCAILGVELIDLPRSILGVGWAGGCFVVTFGAVWDLVIAECLGFTFWMFRGHVVPRIDPGFLSC